MRQDALALAECIQILLFAEISGKRNQLLQNNSTTLYFRKRDFVVYKLRVTLIRGLAQFLLLQHRRIRIHRVDFGTDVAGFNTVIIDGQRGEGMRERRRAYLGGK